MEKRPSARYPTAAEFAQALTDAVEASAIPPTAAVSLPPEPRMSSPAVTREMPMVSTGFGESATRLDMAVSAPPMAPAAIAHPPPRAAWQRWVVALVAIAVVVGVVLGGLVVLGLVELERGGADVPNMPALPTSAPLPSSPGPTPQPLLPSTPGPRQQGALSPSAAGNSCDQLRVCCGAFDDAARPEFCREFELTNPGEPICAGQLATIHQVAVGAGMPPECYPPAP